MHFYSNVFFVISLEILVVAEYERLGLLRKTCSLHF